MTLPLPGLLADRVRALNDLPPRPDARYVLCWIQQALRGVDNPLIDEAIRLGNSLGLPVVVYHGLGNRYPYASHRLHRFILEASASLEDAVIARGMRFIRHVVRPDTDSKGLLYRLSSSAACVLTDDMPVFVTRSQAERFADRADVQVLAVDAACFVPMQRIPTRIEGTSAYRKAHTRLRDAVLDEPVGLMPTAPRYDGPLDAAHHALDLATLDRLIGDCDVDMSLPPAPDFVGTRAAAARLTHALDDVIPRYNWTRNNPAEFDSASRLSPYLHFGVLGPREIVKAVHAADLHSAARYKFLDELLTWREFYYNLARHRTHPDAYTEVPAWGRETLAAHADDPRPTLYTKDQLLRGETDDLIWNAAQRQFLLDGWMHNNLRMYWVKQIIRWVPTPEEAWNIAVEFNDRLSLDGRDPATYGGIQWGFGRSKRGAADVPIYGWVPLKSDAALRSRPGFDAWLQTQTRRDGSGVG